MYFDVREEKGTQKYEIVKLALLDGYCGGGCSGMGIWGGCFWWGYFRVRWEKDAFVISHGCVVR